LYINCILKFFDEEKRIGQAPYFSMQEFANDGIIWRMTGIKALNMFARTIDGFMTKGFSFNFSV
jgi:hypothetical protein